MAKKNVAAAVVDRWGDVGLSASIAPLWRGNSDSYNFGQSNSGGGTVFGSNPEDVDDLQTLPRAEFAVGGSDVDDETIGFKVHSCILEIRVFHDNDSVLENWLDSIISAYDFSDKAGTNPLAMDAGEATVICVRNTSRSVMGFAKGVWVGELEFDVQWARDVSIPA